jgi:hypothetical protein
MDCVSEVLRLCAFFRYRIWQNFKELNVGKAKERDLEIIRERWNRGKNIVMSRKREEMEGKREMV